MPTKETESESEKHRREEIKRLMDSNRWTWDEAARHYDELVQQHLDRAMRPSGIRHKDIH